MPSVRLPAPVVAVRWLGEACRPPAGEEADRGELDLELKPGSSGDVAGSRFIQPELGKNLIQPDDLHAAK